MCALHARGIIDAGIRVAVAMQLRNALFGFKLHIFLAAEMQTAGGTCLDAGRFQSCANTVRAERTLIDFLGGFVKFGNIEWAPSDAILAANTVRLIEVHDTVGVLHDGAIGGARDQAPRLFAVHALVFAHQPLQATISFNFIKFD